MIMQPVPQPDPNTNPELPEWGFRSLFEAVPGRYLVLHPDDPTYTIVAVTKAYAQATLTEPDEIIGRSLFEVFPDNPDDPNATGVRNLHASLRRVLATRAADKMAVQKYDIRRPDVEQGGFEERWWSPENSPVLNADGSVRLIIHCVEDVTEFVTLRHGEAEARRSDSRRGLLVRLMQGQRESSNSQAIMLAASEAVGRYLKADRAGFFEMQDDNTLDFKVGWTAGRLPLLRDAMPAVWIGAGYLAEVRAGKTLGINDARTDPLTADSKFGEIGTVSLIGAPILRRGRWAAGFYVNHADPRAWTEDEISLVGEVAEMTWDVRERLAAEEDRRRSEERLTFALEGGGGVGAWDCDLRTNLVRCNERFARLFSVDPAQATGAGIDSFEFMKAVHPDDRALVGEKVEQAVAQAGTFTVEHRIPQKDGADFWAYSLGRAYHDEQGKPFRFPGVLIDITERKRTEEALKRSRDEARTILESITDGFLVLDRDWRFTYLNAAGEQLLSARREDLLGAGYLDRYPAVRGTLLETEYRRAVRDQTPVEFEFLDEPRQRWFAIKASPTQAGGLSIYFRDVTERRKANDELLRQWHTFDTALSHTPDFTYTFDLKGRFTYVNRALLSLWQKSLEESLGKNFFDLGYPEELAGQLQRQIQQVIETRQPVRDHTHFTGPTGETRQYEYIFVPVLSNDGAVEAVAGSTRDATERIQAEEREREREEQFRESARLESLGIMAGGVAHDFNNLLTGILGNASLLAEGAQPRDRSLANDIVLAAERAAELVKQMLAYSGKGRLVVDVVDLNSLIQENLALLRASISRNVNFELQLGSDACFIEADRAQIQQVAMNLIINASEAIGDSPGTITVRTASTTRTVSSFNIYLQAAAPPGRYVLLEVADSGSGMNPEMLKRIFDPFFTTKFTGRGLGLAAVLGIVRGHQGDIEVVSQVGLGTTFRILLPATERTASRGAGPDVTSGAAGQTVLVVDDEDIVRRMASAALKSRGFGVICAANGAEAVDVLRTHPGVSLVILDLTMPVMTGEQALPLLQAIDAEVPILLSSGYSEAEISRRFASSGIAGVLQKPYTVAGIVSKVKQALQVDR
jgi:two-component system cell cycle sensor histidine kinase/response regulator CckA